jgi:hypothetical protein
MTETPSGIAELQFPWAFPGKGSQVFLNVFPVPTVAEYRRSRKYAQEQLKYFTPSLKGIDLSRGRRPCIWLKNNDGF